MPRNDGKHGAYANMTTDLALYDLRRDPGEEYDVKELHPEVVAYIQNLVDQARLDLGDDLAGAEGTGRRTPGKINSGN
jgi:arylsulfatase